MKKLTLFTVLLFLSTLSFAQKFEYVVSNEGKGYNINYQGLSWDTITKISYVPLKVFVWIKGDEFHFEQAQDTIYEVNSTDLTEIEAVAPKVAAALVERIYTPK